MDKGGNGKVDPLGLASPTYKCPICKEDFVPDLVDSDPNFYDNHFKWRSTKALVQDIWPQATPMQREQLQSRICSDMCWDAAF